MVQNYIVRKLEHKKTENNKVERTQIQIKPKRYKQMKFANIRQYYNKLIESGYDSKKICVVAMGQDKMITIKSFDNDIKDFDDDDYYNDKCIDKSKFDKFFYCNFVLKP